MQPASQTAGAGERPRVWRLVGEKLGDNAQSLALARTLGEPVRDVRIAVQRAWSQTKPLVRPSLHHLDRSACDPLEPPWPELVLAIGRRLSMVALWIKQQSGGRTRVALIGKPRRLRQHFDLVIAPVQYRVRGDNVVRIELPPLQVDSAALARAEADWRTRLGDLSRPLTALLVGGPTRHLRLDADVAQTIVARLQRSRAFAEGSLYVSTSRRTPPAVADALEAALPAGARMHRWREGDAENPYLGLLALADRFAVTSDSISMLVEVARLGRPLAICELPPARRGWHLRRLASRDPDAIPQLLYRRGLAVRLGEPFAVPASRPGADLDEVTARLRALLDGPLAPRGAGMAS